MFGIGQAKSDGKWEGVATRGSSNHRPLRRGLCTCRGRAGRLVIGRLLVWIPACQGGLEQDTEPQIAPVEQLAPRYQCVNG